MWRVYKLLLGTNLCTGSSFVFACVNIRFHKKYSYKPTILGLFQKSRGSNHKSVVKIEFSLELACLGLFLKNVV